VLVTLRQAPARYSKKKTILTDWTQGGLTYVAADETSCETGDFSF